MFTFRTSRALVVASLFTALAVMGCGSERALIAIQIDPPTGELHAGGGATLPLTATGVYDDGTRGIVTTKVTWTSSSSAVATVTSAGVVRAGNTSGTTRIVATSGDVKSPAATIVVLPSSEVVSVEVAPANATIPSGTHQVFTATARYLDGRNADVTLDSGWFSSNPAVALVGARGNTTAVAPGMTTITAGFGGRTGTATLNVTDATLVAIDLEPATATLPVGAWQTFTGMGRYSDGSVHDISSSLSWASLDEDVATIGSTGHATGVSAGTTTITGWLGGISGTATLTVTSATLVRVEVEPAAPPAVAVGRTFAFHATGVYSDGSAVDLTANPGLTWTSDNPAVASISIAAATAGVATALSVGTTHILAVYVNGAHTMQASPVTFAVMDAVLEQIEVTPTTATLPVGFELSFRATGRYSDGHADDITTLVTWSSGTVGTATISNAAGAKGVSTAIAAGTTTITATRDSITGSSVLTVSAARLVSISVSPPTTDVALGGARQFTASGRFDDGSTMSLTSRATWSVAPGDLGRGVTVSNATGRQGLATVAASAVPSATPVTLYATLGSVSGIAQLIVVGPRTLIGIVIDVDQPFIPVGLTAQATAHGIYSDGVHSPEVVEITQYVTWSPLIGGIVTVSNSAGTKGRIAAIARGRDKINACLGAVCADDPGGVGSAAEVEVTDCAFTSLEIYPNSTVDRQIPRGTSRQYRVYGVFGECGLTARRRGFELTELATWNSSNRAVFTVSNALGSRGFVSAMAAPPSLEADLTAMYEDLSATLGLSVIDACVDVLTVSPVAVTLPSGVRFQFSATARLTDGRSIGYTDSASWSDEEGRYVGVIGPGQVQTYLFGGAELITATALASPGCPTRTGTATVTVSDARLTSIDVQPTPVDVPVGGSTQLTATGSYTDGSTHDLTDLTSWTSANNAVATVSGGEVFGVAAGSVVILATQGTVSGTATVSVGGRAVESIEVVPDESFECGTFGDAYGTGTAMPFRAFAYYTDGSRPDDVTALATWGSSVSTIVSVTDGLAQMMSPGTANVTATFGGQTGLRRVDVVAATLRSIDVRPTPFRLPTEATRQFRAFGYYNATGFPSSERCEISSIVTWAALPVLSLTIDGNGLATTSAMPSLSATVTATRGATVGIARGVVVRTCVESINIRPIAASVPLGVTQQFLADAVLSDGSTFDITDEHSTAWSTASSTIATINSRGLATPRGAGTTTVTAVYSVGSASCAAAGAPLSATATLEVSPAALESIDVVCAVDQWGTAGEGIPAGIQTQCNAYGFYAGSGPMLSPAHHPIDLTDSVTWSSTLPAIASISDAVGSKGRVLGRTPGMTTMNATFGGITSGLPFHVLGATLAHVDVEPHYMSLPVGFTEQYGARGRYTLGSSSHSYEITELASWSSSAPTKATVSDAPGTRGEALTVAVTTTPVSIRATYQTVTGAASLSVNDATLRSIEVSARLRSLPIGLTQQYTAIGIYRDGAGPFWRDITDAVTWGTTNPAIAEITPEGVATAASVGLVAITAELGTSSGSLPLLVEDKCITSLELLPSAATVPANVPLGFQVIAHYSTGNPVAITNTAHFRSSDPARMLAPDAEGWTRSARGATPGTVTLSAWSSTSMCAGVDGAQAVVTITGATLNTIVLTSQDGLTVPVGLTRQLRANGYYSDGSSYDITRAVDSWITGSPLIASVSSAPPTQGLLTALSVGATPVVATQGTVSGTAMVTVGLATLTRLEAQGLRTLDGCNSPMETGSWTAAAFAHPAGGYQTRVRAIGYLSDGNTVDLTEHVTWSVSLPDRASVSNAPENQGAVLTGAAGAVELIATADNDLSDSITLNSAAGVLDRLELQRGGFDPIVLALGNSASLTLQGRFGGTYYCVTEDALYSSGEPNVASVSNVDGLHGVVQSLAVGTSFATASIGLVNDTILITVGNPTLSYVAVVPGAVTMRVGATSQLHAEAHYSDGTVNDVTYNTGTSWTSSNLGVAEVGAGAKGLVRGNGVGIATVDACLTGVCGSVGARASAVTVTP